MQDPVLASSDIEIAGSKKRSTAAWRSSTGSQRSAGSERRREGRARHRASPRRSGSARRRAAQVRQAPSRAERQVRRAQTLLAKNAQIVEQMEASGGVAGDRQTVDAKPVDDQLPCRFRGKSFRPGLGPSRSIASSNRALEWRGRGAAARISSVSELSRFEAEIRAGQRFEFGRNWASFLEHLNEDRIQRAVGSLQSMLQVDRLDGSAVPRHRVRQRPFRWPRGGSELESSRSTSTRRAWRVPRSFAAASSSMIRGGSNAAFGSSTGVPRLAGGVRRRLSRGSCTTPAGCGRGWIWRAAAWRAMEPLFIASTTTGWLSAVSGCGQTGAYALPPHSSRVIQGNLYGLVPVISPAREPLNTLPPRPWTSCAGHLGLRGCRSPMTGSLTGWGLPLESPATSDRAGFCNPGDSACLSPAR